MAESCVLIKEKELELLREPSKKYQKIIDNLEEQIRKLKQSERTLRSEIKKLENKKPEIRIDPLKLTITIREDRYVGSYMTYLNVFSEPENFKLDSPLRAQINEIAYKYAEAIKRSHIKKIESDLSLARYDAVKYYRGLNFYKKKKYLNQLEDDRLF